MKYLGEIEIGVKSEVSFEEKINLHVSRVNT